MRWSLFPARATEATLDQLVSTGAAGGYGIDPIDGDTGFRPAGSSLGREMPIWTLDKQRAYSVAAYRANPMARAIVDTYTSFCIGDSGLSLNCTSPEVRARVDAFWNDPKVKLGTLQELLLRSHMLMGESIYELMVGNLSGVVRFSPIDPGRLASVDLEKGNPLWPSTLHIRNADGGTDPMAVMAINDVTGLREGDAMFWPSWKAMVTDRRGAPFLGPVLDDLDAYDQVLSNLVDRTALMRYIAFDVTVQGDDTDVDDFIRKRNGTHIPASGSMEVHNQSVEWTPLSAEVGATEDTTTAGAVLTKVAGGAGLSKTWLAEPDGANRATSLTMAEPVRRRVGGVQNTWIDMQTELVRFVVDQSVAAGRLADEVPTVDITGKETTIDAAMTVTITGPEIAAADAQVNAEILVNLSKSLTEMVAAQLLTPEAARVAAKKGWEQFVGIPYNPDLDKPDGSTKDDLADVISKATPAAVTLRLS